MATRRGFVAGMLAAGLVPKPTWADAGSPEFMAAARVPDGSYHLVGLTGHGEELFRIPLPDRGHAAAAHPTRPDAVAFARRPGTFAVVFDCRDGTVRARLTAPEGRHFYGHGAYTEDGALLLTTENDFNEVRGVIGVWDVASGYERIDEFPSGGVGPHEILRLPGGGFAIANGGIETSPTSGREKLNLPIMAPNLSYATASGSLTETVALPADLHLNSIRHVAARADGLLAVAMQWQGAAADYPPLLAMHRRGEELRPVQAEHDIHRQMENYVGSVSFSGDGSMVAITSPVGGRVQVFEADTGECLGNYVSTDVCGVAASAEGFAITSGTGEVAGLSAVTPLWRGQDRLNFDHHLVRITALTA